MSEHIGKVISPVRFTLRQEVILMSKQAKWKNLVRDIAFLISLSRVRLNGTRNSYKYERCLLLIVQSNLIYSLYNIHNLQIFFWFITNQTPISFFIITLPYMQHENMPYIILLYLCYCTIQIIIKKKFDWINHRNSFSRCLIQIRIVGTNVVDL